MTIYTLLNFSRVELTLNPPKTEATLSVYFHKPNQSSYQNHMGSDYTEVITHVFNISKQLKIFDFNRKVQVLNQLNSDGLDLYFAVYWDKNTMDQPMLCISVEPIELNWYDQTAEIG